MIRTLGCRQAVCYASYMLTCLFSPYLMSVFGPKWTLFLGSACFTVYQVSFSLISSNKRLGGLFLLEQLLLLHLLRYNGSRICT